MKSAKVLRGIELRYVLTVTLANLGSMSVADLGHELREQGFETAGQRPSKAISDALRWEVLAGRVIRYEHGTYGSGVMPRSTEYRIRRRVQQLKEQALLGDEEPAEPDDWLGRDWLAG
jgi:hypothetical protein